MQNVVGAQSFEIKTKVFISYSRKDMVFADKLEAALKARGFEVLIDRQEIYAFEDWWKRIEALIGGADTVVFVLSPDAVKSDVALKEVAHAASLNKRFAPIVCRHVDDADVPETLRRLNFIFFDDPARFEASTERLIEALQTDIAWVRRHTEFGDTAHRWAEAGRPSGMLLRPPVLDQAEAWLAFRPGGAPAPTKETEAFIAQSRKVMLGTQRLRRIALASIFVLMTAVIVGLVGWMNQDYLKGQWRWWTVTRPYAAARVRPYVLSAAKEQGLIPGNSFRECAKDCPEMVVVPAGSFTMGGPKQFEQPQHTVTFSRPFAVAKYELTFADWDACVAGGGCDDYRPNDLAWGRGNRPVINVSWDDAQHYVAWLSEVTGRTYRLLSEAEYEYVMRAGTTTAYYWGNDIEATGTVMANCDGCGSKWDKRQTAPVGSFPPNAYGLYDMLGNILEWVEDCHHVNYNGAPADGRPWTTGGNCQLRMVRSGSWDRTPDFFNAASRNVTNHDLRSYDLGFRVARTLDVAALTEQQIDQIKHKQQLENCFKNKTIESDLEIAGCTALIESGKINKEELKRAHNRRAEAYYHKGDYDNAIADLTEVIKLFPSAVAYENRGIAYVGKGDYGRAIADYTQAITLNSKNAAYYERRGNEYFDTKNYDQAIADYTQAIALNAKDSAYYDDRGIGYYRKGDLDRAIADFSEAIRLDPNEAVLYKNRGAAYLRKDDVDRTIADYSQAIRFTPKDGDAYRERGDAYLHKDDYVRAAADYTGAIRLDPKDARAYLHRGLASLYGGSLANAQADVDQSSMLDPKNAFTALWMDIVDKRSNLPSRLAEATKQIDMNNWPAPVVRLYLGQMTPEAVLAAADNPDTYTKKVRKCEANFYGGELTLQRGANGEATRLFKLAAADCPKDFTEWWAANAELKVLHVQP